MKKRIRESLEDTLEKGGKEDFGRYSKMSSFVLQMGSHLSSAKAPVSSAKSPLNCILTHWDLFDPWTLTKEHLRFFCTQGWPGYRLECGEKWFPDGSINFNEILQLDSFCEKKGKWIEVPYVQRPSLF